MTGFLKKRIKNKQNRGFTLIELMVTIVIFVILTAVVLFSQSGFNNTILLNNLAYDISLAIRQAQYYGVNSNESQLINVFSPFGVYFNIGSGGSATNFVFFADTDNSGTFYGNLSEGSVTSCPANDTECIQKYTINSGNYISGICATPPGSSVSNCGLSNLTILFQRPNPDARIYYDSNGTRIGPCTKADITVSSANGNKKNIIITGIGQIYVQ